MWPWLDLAWHSKYIIIIHNIILLTVSYSSTCTYTYTILLQTDLAFVHTVWEVEFPYSISYPQTATSYSHIKYIQCMIHACLLYASSTFNLLTDHVSYILLYTSGEGILLPCALCSFCQCTTPCHCLCGTYSHPPFLSHGFLPQAHCCRRRHSCIH